MKSPFCLINHFIISLCLIISSQIYPSIVFSQTTDTTLDAERIACSKNTASEWNAALNRCVQKKEAQAARHEVEDCAALTDIEQRKACHKRIAEQKTGLSSDVNSLPSDGTNKSMLMNGVGTAYAAIGLINSTGSKGKTSSCTSKKIFAVTAIAGTATDIWLKMKAKKAMDELKNKYQLGVKNNAYDNQSKAFEFLKAEQQTVKEIASREKKRNMLLTLGYGAALLMAIYEMTPIGQNPDCYKPAEPADASKTPDATKVADANAPVDGASNTAVANTGDATTPQVTSTPAGTTITSTTTTTTTTTTTSTMTVSSTPQTSELSFRFDPETYSKANMQLDLSGLQKVNWLPGQ